MDFSGGTLDKNSPVNAADASLIPGPERLHMLWST